MTFNVKDYQAVGDGVTDDTTAIRAALTAATSASNSIVYVPPGTYKTTGVLTVPAGVTLAGSGPSAVIKCSNTTADVNTGNKSAITIGRGASATVRNLKVDGNSVTEVGVEISGYSDGQINFAKFIDVQVTGCTVAGVKIQAGFRHEFRGCKIFSNAVGVWIPATVFLASLGQFDFNSCWIHDNTSDGVYFQRGDIVNFFGGNVENNGGYGFHFDPSASGQLCTGMNIHGVNIEANTLGGLLAHDFTQGVTATGNYFAASSIQPKAFQLDGAGGANHYFAGNFQTGHASASSNSSSNSTIIPGRLLSESAITGNTQTIYSKPTVTGSKGANAALTSLMTALVALGLVTDSTT